MNPNIMGFIRSGFLKPWVFITVVCMNSDIMGFIGSGFLNQVSTLIP